MSCDFRTFDQDVIETLLEHKVNYKSNKSKARHTMTFTPPQLRPITKKWRGVSPETFARYSVGLDDANNVHFPYFVDGKHVGSKVRSATEKKFWFIGESTGIGLFGTHCAQLPVVGSKRSSLALYPSSPARLRHVAAAHGHRI